VDFIIVVNPANGPGSGALPDANYTREITRLNTYSNVRTIGYVAVDYGRRPIANAFADIAKYAGWPGENQRLSMQGIFLDESPQLADSHNISYLQQVRNNVKSTRQLSGGLLGKFFWVGWLVGWCPDYPINSLSLSLFVFALLFWVGRCFILSNSPEPGNIFAQGFPVRL
jgi:hypothetical protein